METQTLAGNGKGEGSNLLQAECSKVLKAKQEKQQPNPKATYSTVPRKILEVFSVRFLQFQHHDLEHMYGCILISSFPTYVVFSRKDGDPLCINPQGYVKIRGPDRVIQPSDSTIIIPYLFRYQACADQFKDNKDELLINTILDHYSYDKLLSRRVLSQFGQIELNCAIYKDGLEARVDVTLLGCQFPSATVYGQIFAQNSKLGEQGRSFLFDRDKNEGICINTNACKDGVVQLPLARCKTAVPAGSFLAIYVNIWQGCTIGAPDQPIMEIKNCEFTPRLGDQEVKTFSGAACQVNVGVTWPGTAEYGTGQQGFYA